MLQPMPMYCHVWIMLKNYKWMMFSVMILIGSIITVRTTVHINNQDNADFHKREQQQWNVWLILIKQGGKFCYLYLDALNIFTPWPFRPTGYCRCLRLSVCPSFRPSIPLSVHKLYLVRMLTHHKFELESPNLHQTCIMGYSWLVLKIRAIDHDLQGHFGHFDSEF